MDPTFKLISCAIFISLIASTQAQNCSNYGLAGNRVYASCNDLPVLSSFLYWTYNQPAATLDVAFRHTGADATRWVAWALNPDGPKMMGSQALVAFQNSSGALIAYTSPVTSMNTKLEEGGLAFKVSNLAATFLDGEIIIFATLALPANMTTVAHVWQEGPVSGGAPMIHPTTGANMLSTGTLNFVAGIATVGGGTSGSINRKKNVHGVLNAVGWGTLMPVGAMIARYLKVFKSASPAWFYLHVTIQTSAYAIGVAGWATGLKLGSASAGIQHDLHRNLGIALFSLATLQLFAMLLRPKPDHKYRLYWNIYHHSIGYAVIVMSIINVFEGLDILEPEKRWKKIYTGILIFLGFNAVMLEAFTWFVVTRRKKESSYKVTSSMNRANGMNGHGML